MVSTLTETCSVPVGKGKFLAFVDAEDYDLVSKYNWVVKRGNLGIIYARRVWHENGRYKDQLMHRLITKNKWQKVDHVNHDGLDNRRSNLRDGSEWRNGSNTYSLGGTSKYKGVFWYPKYNKWATAITHNTNRKTIGYFDDEVQAALAFDEAARRLHGDYGRYNFPREGELSAFRPPVEGSD